MVRKTFDEFLIERGHKDLAYGRPMALASRIQKIARETNDQLARDRKISDLKVLWERWRIF